MARKEWKVLQDVGGLANAESKNLAHTLSTRLSFRRTLRLFINVFLLKNKINIQSEIINFLKQYVIHFTICNESKLLQLLPQQLLYPSLKFIRVQYFRIRCSFEGNAIVIVHSEHYFVEDYSPDRMHRWQSKKIKRCGFCGGKMEGCVDGKNPGKSGIHVLESWSILC